MALKAHSFHRTKSAANKAAAKLLRKGKTVKVTPYASEEKGKGYAVWSN